MSQVLDQASLTTPAPTLKGGQTFAVGGFGLCGIPEALIAALRDTGVCRASRASATTRVSTASDSGCCWKPVRSRK
ncbi:MAG: Succinyl-CoA:3-ketoacid-coenzyme A transferase subunit A (EC [uncultured Caballeronia sp.]|nr:MAG: Succinyl-CoA:3-ketoacid-coenzyme A transferase subunit A (EC [uncultured Caballeronia sp.]